MSVVEVLMNEMQGELEAVELEDKLNDSMADLLSERQNEPFYTRSFGESLAPGAAYQHYAQTWKE